MQQIINSCIFGIGVMIMHKTFLELMFIHEKNALLVNKWRDVYKKNTLLIDMYVISIVLILNVLLCKYKIIDFNCCEEK